MSDSRHPGFPSWLDYARLGPDAGEGRPAAHLGSGCAPCQATADSLTALASFVRVDGEYEPPPDVLARAIAVFDQGGVTKDMGAEEIFAEIVYDSRSESAQAGMRSTSIRPTQLLYQADRFCLDVQLTRENASNQILLVGQIVDRLDQERGVARAPLTVASANDTLARSFTNEFGEFQVEYVPQGDLRLHIVVDDGRAFVIPLPRLSEMEKP